MEEEVAGLPEAAPLGGRPGDAGGPIPIGAYLARQRRLRGISLGELARLTCIPLRSLERLESGAFDETPDGFARGFVRTVASALGLDPDETVARMLPESAVGTRGRPARPVQPGVQRAGVHRPGVRWLGNPWLRNTVLVTTALVLGWWVWGRAWAPPPAPEDLRAQHVYRHDAIRELARSRGLLEARAPAPPAEPSAGVR